MSAALLAGFLARERRLANPVIDPALFRDRRFTWGMAATVAVTVGLRNLSQHDGTASAGRFPGDRATGASPLCGYWIRRVCPLR
jgi:hypothetical protein